MRGRLFQRFQQRVGCADRHAVGVVDQTDFSFTDERTVHDLVLDFPDLLDLDLLGGLLRIRFDDKKVRMRASFDLLAGSASTTTVEAFYFGRPFTVECLRKTNGCQSFPDGILAVKQIGVSQSLMGDGGL